MRLGLIGLKGHHNVVLHGARELADVDVVAVADDQKAAIESLKSEYPEVRAAQTYSDWRHLVEHALMDVCYIGDETVHHPDQIIALAERNVDIVTEKPLATTLEDLDRIRAALAPSRSRMTMLLTMRHEAKYVKARQLVREGVIGTICLATAQKSYRLRERPDWQRSRARLGGTIPYIGIHAIDLVRWVTGLDFTHVAAFHGQLGKPEMKETEDHASILLRLANGASATVRLDYLRPEAAPSHGDDQLRIAGSDGVLEVGYPGEDVMVITRSTPPTRIKADPTPNLFADFVRAKKENRAPRIPAEDCMYATEIVLRARDAADSMTLIPLANKT